MKKGVLLFLAAAICLLGMSAEAGRAQAEPSLSQSSLNGFWEPRMLTQEELEAELSLQCSSEELADIEIDSILESALYDIGRIYMYETTEGPRLIYMSGSSWLHGPYSADEDIIKVEQMEVLQWHDGSLWMNYEPMTGVTIPVPYEKTMTSQGAIDANELRGAYRVIYLDENEQVFGFALEDFSVDSDYLFTASGSSYQVTDDWNMCNMFSLSVSGGELSTEVVVLNGWTFAVFDGEYLTGLNTPVQLQKLSSIEAYLERFGFGREPQIEKESLTGTWTVEGDMLRGDPLHVNSFCFYEDGHIEVNGDKTMYSLDIYGDDVWLVRGDDEAYRVYRLYLEDGKLVYQYNTEDDQQQHRDVYMRTEAQ